MTTEFNKHMVKITTAYAKGGYIEGRRKFKGVVGTLEDEWCLVPPNYALDFQTYEYRIRNVPVDVYRGVYVNRYGKVSMGKNYSQASSCSGSLHDRPLQGVVEFSILDGKIMGADYIPV